jgi:tetratricopeptide (TPR) repeat protein
MARQPAKSTSPKKPPARRRAKAAPVAEIAAAPPKKRGIGLPHVEAASTKLRTVLLNFAFVGAFLVLTPVIVSQFWRDEVMIDRIPVPEALAEVGLTSDVAANRLWDGIRDATKRANTAKDSVTALPNSRRVEFSLPESGFSMESLIQQTRAFFHAYQTRISGEFTCADLSCDPKGMRLRLRVLRETSKVIDLPPIGETPLRDYFTNAAVQVLTELDPFVAVASIAETEPLRATVLARNLVRQKHPDAKWAHVLIGIMKKSVEETDASVAEFQAALDLDPNFFIARRNLAARLVSAGRLNEAGMQYELLAKKWADEVEVIAGQGELAYAEARYPDAAAFYARAAGLNPREPLYVARQGDVALASGDVEGGLALLQRALQIDPAFMPAMASLTAHHFSNGNIFETKPLFEDYAEIAPDVADAQAMYGQVLRVNGDSATGLEYLLKAQALEPERADIAEAIGSTYVDLGDLEQAEAVFRRSLEIDDKNPAVHAQLGRVYNFMGRRDEALASWRKAVELEPGNVAYVAGAAEVLMYAQRYDEALVEFDKALAIEPERPETWSFKGATLKYMGRKDEAVAALSKFLELSEGKPEYFALRQLAEDEIKAIGVVSP